MCNAAGEQVSLSVKGGRVASLLKLALKQHQQPSTPTPVPQTQHGKLYTGREERCVQAHRDRKQVRVTTGVGRGDETPTKVEPLRGTIHRFGLKPVI